VDVEPIEAPSSRRETAPPGTGSRWSRALTPALRFGVPAYVTVLALDHWQRGDRGRAVALVIPILVVGATAGLIVLVRGRRRSR
jgi:hypothetical protein